jgi:hypothetical protein
VDVSVYSIGVQEIRIMKLTNKEQQLLDSIIEGMDEPGCGWLHELNPFNNDKVCAGVLSALIQKGLVHSYKDDEGVYDCYWVELVI